MSDRLPFPPLVLAVAGCSGSGKTTLAAEVARTLGGLHFHFDNYYRDLSHLAPELRAVQDFDDPAILEIELLRDHVAALARGEVVERPFYDFATHTRVAGKTEPIVARELLVVEGILALHYQELLPFYQAKVFVETPEELCLERRLRRDIAERGRSRESVLAQYAATVKPAAERFVMPSAAVADLVIDGRDELDWKVEQVYALLRQRSLWRLPE